ncbi:ATP-binding protein [Terriglobus aquaticus]|uniref:histidine kinase n=1 Tax=Terriglobus aquaticus TaxID=940139 RepID=A0ABW9KKL8_9BACT
MAISLRRLRRAEDSLRSQHTVFDRFYRGSEQPRENASGAGLGLAVSRLVVERSGGRIYFDKNTSSGARCVVQLPLARV